MYDFRNDIQVSKTQYDRVWGYINAGIQEGAKAILGGIKRPGKGFYADPTSESVYSAIVANIYLIDFLQSSQRSDPT